MPPQNTASSESVFNKFSLANHDRMVNKKQHDFEVLAKLAEVAIPDSNTNQRNHDSESCEGSHCPSKLSILSYIAIGLVIVIYCSIFCFCKIRDNQRKRQKQNELRNSQTTGLFTLGKPVIKNNAPYPEPFVIENKVILNVFHGYYPSYGGDYA